MNSNTTNSDNNDDNFSMDESITSRERSNSSPIRILTPTQTAAKKIAFSLPTHTPSPIQSIFESEQAYLHQRLNEDIDSVLAEGFKSPRSPLTPSFFIGDEEETPHSSEENDEESEDFDPNTQGVFEMDFSDNEEDPSKSRSTSPTNR